MTKYSPRHGQKRQSSHFSPVFTVFSVFVVVTLSFSVFLNSEFRSECQDKGGVVETWYIGGHDGLKGTPKTNTVCVEPKSNKQYKLDSDNAFSYVKSRV